MSSQSPNEWVLRGRAVVTPEGVRPAAILVSGEHIAAVVDFDQVPAGMPVTDAGDKLVLPGLVDTHVHINEPGRTDWEGFETATKAAAAGGITTLIDMPLNSSPVTTTVAALHAKREAAEGKLWVDVGFHGGVVPGNVEHIRPLIREGVCAFKAFLCPSGIDEFPNVTEADLRQVMPILAEAGIPLFVHAELVSPLPQGVEEHFAAYPRSYQAYLATRPPEWEVAAVRMMIDLCREYRCPVHIVHLSAAAETKPLIKNAKLEGLPFSVETCPHYLTFAAGDFVGADTRYKCAPPIRTHDQQGQLRALVSTGLIDTLGSDHSPAPPHLKHLGDGDLRKAWGGIASLQLLLPASWSALGDMLRPMHFVSLLAGHPAALVGVADRKGTIAPNHDADFAIADLGAAFTVDSSMLYHRHKATPYMGHQLHGVVESTILRGRPIYSRGQHFGGPGGRTLRRDASAKRC